MPVSHLVVAPLPDEPKLQPPAGVAIDLAAITPFQDELPVPPAVHFDERRGHPVFEVVLRNKLVQVHSALGRVTPVWSYDVRDTKTKQWLANDFYLGPTLVVRRGQRVTVVYENGLHGYSAEPSVQHPLTGRVERTPDEAGNDSTGDLETTRIRYGRVGGEGGDGDGASGLFAQASGTGWCGESDCSSRVSFHEAGSEGRRR